jgi:hypothetical protein
LFRHEPRKRHAFRERLCNVEVRRLPLLVKRAVERCDKRVLDLASRQAFAGPGKLDNIIVLWIAAILGDLNAPDGFTFRLIGQVYEEQFIEPAFAKHFRWKLRHVVSGGDDEHRRGFLLHPSDERSEHSGSCAAVSRT